jgi:hypothetical protein
MAATNRTTPTPAQHMKRVCGTALSVAARDTARALALNHKYSTEQPRCVYKHGRCRKPEPPPSSLGPLTSSHACT